MVVEEDPKHKDAPLPGTTGKAATGSGFGRAVGGGTTGSSLVTAELRKLSAEVRAACLARTHDRGCRADD